MDAHDAGTLDELEVVFLALLEGRAQGPAFGGEFIGIELQNLGHGTAGKQNDRTGPVVATGVFGRKEFRTGRQVGGTGISGRGGGVAGGR